jgi:E3 ubiquitin-protein ligase DOA10
MVVLVAVAGAAFLVVHLLTHIRLHSVAWVGIAVLWFAAIAAIVFVDVNIPLSDSQLRPSSMPAPLWLTLVAAFARFAALASIFMARQILQRSVIEPDKPLQPIAREDTRSG